MMPELLRERRFRRYWTGQTVSLFGDQITLIAVPLTAVLVLRADAAQIGWVSAAALAPALLALPLGAWADRRRRRRRVMVLADLGRALLIASLPAAYVMGALSLPQLYVVGFGVGLLSVVFDLCNATVFVALVPVSSYVAGHSLVNGSRAFSQVAGPSVGGLLVQLFAAPFALFMDALSYVASARLLTRVADLTEPPPAPRERGMLGTGIRWIMGDGVTRASLAASGTVQLFTFMLNTLFVLYATSELGLRPGVLGAVLGAGAVGGLIGAALASRCVRVLGAGPTAIWGFVVFTAPLMIIPLAAGPEPVVVTLLFLAEFACGLGAIVTDIAMGAIRDYVVPDPLRARVMGAYRTLSHGFRPLGALIGGALGSALGLRPTLLIAAFGALLAVLWLLPSPLPRLRALAPVS